MVKEIRIIMDDSEHQSLKDAKGDKTYKEYLLEKVNADCSIINGNEEQMD